METNSDKFQTNHLLQAWQRQQQEARTSFHADRYVYACDCSLLCARQVYRIDLWDSVVFSPILSLQFIVQSALRLPSGMSLL
jgi:hypothetical protein